MFDEIRYELIIIPCRYGNYDLSAFLKIIPGYWWYQGT